MPTKLNIPNRPWEPVIKRKPQEGRRRDNNSFYCSSAWRKVRAAKLQDQPLCEYCLAKGRTRLATLVDHYKQFEDSSDPLALDWDNFRSSCDKCHNSKSGKEAHGKGY